MSYIDLGYNSRLSKTSDSEISITDANVDAIVESGAIGYQQSSLNVISGNQTLRSSNFVGGQTGWIIRGDGTAEFQSLASKEFVKVYSQDDPPTGDLNIGDVWYDTNDGNKRYIWDGGAWAEDTTDANWSGVIDDDGNKPDNNATVGANWTSNLTNIPASATASYITSTKITTTTIESPTVTAGTITGSTIQTSTATYPAVKLTTGGLDISGESVFQIRKADGTLCGSIDGLDGTVNERMTLKGPGDIYMLSLDDINIAATKDAKVVAVDDMGLVCGDLLLIESQDDEVRVRAGVEVDIRSDGNVYIDAGDDELTLATNTDDINLFSELDVNIQTLGGSGYIKMYGDTRPLSARTWSIGTATHPFLKMYADTYYFTKSGATTKYIQLNASSGIDCAANFYVGGTLSKSAGSFKIDHPIKPDTHWLQHSFVESPDMLNIYRGNGEIVDGEFTTTMPDWFIPLNGDNQDDYSYQLTSIGQQNDLWVKKEMDSKGTVSFAGSKEGKFSYIITAIRHDDYAEKNRIVIEEVKN